MARIDLEISRELAGERLDRAIARLLPELSRGKARALIDEGRVFVDGKRCRVSSRLVEPGAHVVIHETAAAEAPADALRVIYEDEDAIAIDKRAGEIINETETSAELSVVERLRAKDAYTVHRIDRETSGVVILAKGKKMAEMLSRAFHDRLAQKTYVAIVKGELEDQLIDAPIGADRRRPRARAVVPVASGGKASATHIATISKHDGLSAIEAHPITGRTHQIRVHLAHRGAPIVGDALYGGPVSVRAGGEVITPGRVMLHAARLVLPVRGVVRTFEAAIPDDMKRFERAGLLLAR